MPPGLVATVGIDNAKNAGILAAQMIAISIKTFTIKSLLSKEQPIPFLQVTMHSFSDEYNQYKTDPLIAPNNEKNILLPHVVPHAVEKLFKPCKHLASS